MKILLLTDYYPPDKLGGVGEIAKNLRETYEDMGYDTWVLTTGTSLEKSRIIRSSRSLIKGVFINNFKVIRLIRREKIDTIHMHQSSTTLFLLTKHLPFLYKKFPKVICSFQVSYFSEFRNIKKITVQGHTFKPSGKEYLEKWLFAPIHIFLDFLGFMLSDEVTVVSGENKKEFMNTYGKLSRKKIHIIANGVNTEDFQPKSNPKISSNLKKKLAGKKVLLYVGVFRTRKRVFNLIFALKEVLKIDPDVVLVIVGGGRNFESEINNLAIELGVSKKILNVGKVKNSEIVEYLNMSDLFCLISSYEGMPIAILEAMSCGKPVLTSRVSGMIDLIDDKKTGYLADVDNIEQITDKICYAIGDLKTNKNLGIDARKKVIKSYSWSKIAHKYSEIFS